MTAQRPPGESGRRSPMTGAGLGWLVPAVVVVLVLLAVAGAAGRRGLELDSTGPLAGQRDALLAAAAGFVVADLVIVMLVGLILRRRRRRPRFPDRPQLEDEPAQLSVWARRLITVAVFVLMLAPIWLLLVVFGPDRQRPRDSRSHDGSGLPGDMVPALTPAALSLFVLFTVTALVVLAMRLIPAYLVTRRRSETKVFDGPPEVPGLVEAISAGDSALREPAADARSAIIACYAAMERVLAEHGAARNAADTPAELLDRAVGAGLIRSDAAMRLTELFREARFSSHPMAEPERTAATAALSELAADLYAVRR